MLACSSRQVLLVPVREVTINRLATPQNAAGVYSYLLPSAVPKLRSTLGDEEMPLDLTEPIIKGLEWLMLAQAQECVWQRAVLGTQSHFLARMTGR